MPRSGAIAVQSSEMPVNPIINGAMEIRQRPLNGFVDLSVTNSSYRGPDRWTHGGVVDPGSGVVEVLLNTDAPTLAQAGFNFTGSRRVEVTTASSDSNPSNWSSFRQRIEGLFFKPFINRKCVYEFWQKSNKAGDYGLFFGNFNSSQFWTDQISEPGDEVWRKFQIPVDFSSSDQSQFQTDSNVGMQVLHLLRAESNIVQPLSTIRTWQDFGATTPAFIPTGQVNFMDTIGNRIWTTGHQLRAVTDAEYDAVINGEEINLPFVRAGETIDGEVALCQRYYKDLPHLTGTSINTFSMTIFAEFEVPMRIPPVALVDGNAGINAPLNAQRGTLNTTMPGASSISTPFGGTNWAVINVSGWTGLPTNQDWTVGVPANNGNTIRVTAEL